MTLLIKTCGLRDEAVIDVAIAAGATHLGFIHYERSPRHVDLAEAGRLIAHAGPRAQTVIVTVNADDALLDRIVREADPDMLQLHGAETPERVEAVRARYGLPVMKAFSVAEASDLLHARAFAEVADETLFDAKPARHALLPGGNGVAFDHALLEQWQSGPFWLSGGLNSTNVVEAVARVNPRGIDLSSGLESAPGVKDPASIRALFELLNADPQVDFHSPAAPAAA